MLVGYMRVSTDGEQQVLDLQRDPCSPPASMSGTWSRTACAATIRVILSGDLDG